MSYTGFDDNNDRYKHDDMDEKVRHWRRVIRKSKSGEELPGLDLVESLVHYCIDTEKYEEGAEFCRLWTDYLPTSGEAHQKLAFILSNLGHYWEAEEAIEKALLLNPNDPEALTTQAIILDDSGNPETAFDIINKALDLEPDNDEILYHKAIILQGLGEFEKSLRILLYLTKSDLFTKSRLLLDISECYEDMGIINKAVEFTNKIIDEDPYDREMWLRRGILHQRADQFYQSIDCFELAIAIDENCYSAWHLRGNSFTSMGRATEAIDSFHEALLIKPDYRASMYQLANCYSDIGNYVKAIEQYSNLIRIDAEHYLAYFGRGLCYDALESFERAIEDYNSSIAINPDYAEVWYARGDAYYNLDMPEEAAGSYEKYLEIDPLNTECMLDLGIIQYELDRLDEALLTLYLTSSFEPKWTEPYYYLAKTYVKLKMLAEAEELFLKAIRKDKRKLDDLAEDYANSMGDSEFKAMFDRILEEFDKS